MGNLQESQPIHVTYVLYIVEVWSWVIVTAYLCVANTVQAIGNSAQMLAKVMLQLLVDNIAQNKRKPEFTGKINNWLDSVCESVQRELWSAVYIP